MYSKNNNPARLNKRYIGFFGTIVRIGLGGYLAGSVLYGAGISPGGFLHSIYLIRWILGLVVFPLIMLSWQWLRLRRNPSEFKNIGPIGITFNFGLFWVLYFIPMTSDIALVFYGISMVVAGIRGYSGCEILAISNMLLRRDDQIGCALFTPIDVVEKRLLQKMSIR